MRQNNQVRGRWKMYEKSRVANDMRTSVRAPPQMLKSVKNTVSCRRDEKTFGQLLIVFLGTAFPEIVVFVMFLRNSRKLLVRIVWIVFSFRQAYPTAVALWSLSFGSQSLPGRITEGPRVLLHTPASEEANSYSLTSSGKARVSGTCVSAFVKIITPRRFLTNRGFRHWFQEKMQTNKLQIKSTHSNCWPRLENPYR